MLKRACDGCGEDAVASALAPLVLVFGVSDSARSTAFWRIYKQQLAGLPREALAASVDEYAGLPDSHFFPKPGPLRALAIKHAAPLYQAASRARRALSLGPKKVVDKSPEAIELVRRMAAEPLGRPIADEDAA